MLEEDEAEQDLQKQLEKQRKLKQKQLEKQRKLKQKQLLQDSGEKV